MLQLDIPDRTVSFIPIGSQATRTDRENFQKKGQLAEYKESFQLFDKDGNGSISRQEISSVLHDLGQNPTESELKILMETIDINQDGTIDFNEFVILMETRLKKEEEEEIDYEAEILEAFKVFDEDGSGKISTKELMNVMRKLGEKLTDSEFERMIQEADVDGDGEINFNEFRKMIQDQ